MKIETIKQRITTMLQFLIGEFPNRVDHDGRQIYIWKM